MGIKRVVDSTVLTAGHLVCVQTTREHISFPHRIVEVRGAKIHFLIDGRSKIKLKKSIVYIVDTEAEGNALADAYIARSNERDRLISLATQKVKDEVNAKWRPHFQALLGGQGDDQDEEPGWASG